jgi:hypothetical protein
MQTIMLIHFANMAARRFDRLSAAVESLMSIMHSQTPGDSMSDSVSRLSARSFAVLEMIAAGRTYEFC